MVMFMFSTIFVLLTTLPIIIQSALFEGEQAGISDPIWPLPLENDLSSGGDSSASDLAALFTSSASLAQSVSSSLLYDPAQGDNEDSLFENTMENSSESEIGLDGLDFLASAISDDDCSATSMLFPAVGKSRRRDEQITTNNNFAENQKCQNPAATDGNGNGADNIPGTTSPPVPEGDNDAFRQILYRLTTVQKMQANAISNEDQNPYCFLFTGELYPWGVCSSGNPFDIIIMVNPLTITGFGVYTRFVVNQCTLGTFFSLPAVFFFHRKKQNTSLI